MTNLESGTHFWGSGMPTFRHHLALSQWAHNVQQWDVGSMGWSTQQKPWDPQPAPAFWVAPSTCDIIGSDVVISEDVNPSLEKTEATANQLRSQLGTTRIAGVVLKVLVVCCLTDLTLYCFLTTNYIMIHYIS